MNLYENYIYKYTEIKGEMRVITKLFIFTIIFFFHAIFQLLQLAF